MISSVSWLITEEFGALATAVGLAAQPIAILKYRLYDIDVVINRARVYGSLTGFAVGRSPSITSGSSRSRSEGDI
jgi:hypothetical protein